MLVQQIDAVRAQTPERRFDHFPDVFGAAVRARERALADDEAELGRDPHLVAPACERAAQQFLVRVRPVDFGRVEEGAAQVDGAVDRRDRFRVVRCAIRMAHAHAAQSDGGNLESFRAQFACRQHVVSFAF